MTFECGHGKDGTETLRAKALSQSWAKYMAGWSDPSALVKDFFRLVIISVMFFRIYFHLSLKYDTRNIHSFLTELLVVLCTAATQYFLQLSFAPSLCCHVYLQWPINPFLTQCVFRRVFHPVDILHMFCFEIICHIVLEQIKFCSLGLWLVSWAIKTMI